MCQISELSKKYKNMQQLIDSLQKGNENNVNQSFIMVSGNAFCSKSAISGILRVF